ncbi:hypothetical protein YB2330_001899 [Saitoella coloradoensis]
MQILSTLCTALTLASLANASLFADLQPQRVLAPAPTETAIPPPIWQLCGNPSEHTLQANASGVTIVPESPVVGENLTVTIQGYLSHTVDSGSIDVDLRLMKFIKLKKNFDLCDELDSDLFVEGKCPLQEGPVTLQAVAHIPDDVPKVTVDGDIILTDQDDNVITCVRIALKLKGKDE